MKKRNLKTLKLLKETVSSLATEAITGGTMGSGMCTSSNNYQCHFQCATAPADGC
ncbi:hypothetical protein IMCC3317_07010 [Kordia antarctica]|uniref:Uncharacterized protein n=1 Tax=Kordia antarctica TaxID=1218801 RepID=A0A7L4ZFG6_9FLAO|nr:hypothetical protein [Kordia antarctica]QHI35355.1 hypothetical protein IMCC3317_07010 [Kordia antarctica]